MDAWELGAVISLTNIGALRVRASTADVGDLGVGAFITDFWRKGVCKNSVCSRNSPQPSLGPPKSEWHDGQRQINEAGKCIRENTTLRTKFRGGVRVQAWRV